MTTPGESVHVHAGICCLHAHAVSRHSTAPQHAAVQQRLAQAGIHWHGSQVGTQRRQHLGKRHSSSRGRRRSGWRRCCCSQRAQLCEPRHRLAHRLGRRRRQQAAQRVAHARRVVGCAQQQATARRTLERQQRYWRCACCSTHRQHLLMPQPQLSPRTWHGRLQCGLGGEHQLLQWHAQHLGRLLRCHAAPHARRPQPVAHACRQQQCKLKLKQGRACSTVAGMPSCTRVPGATRPARPRRCCAAAWLTQVSASRLSPRDAS